MSQHIPAPLSFFLLLIVLGSPFAGVRRLILSVIVIH